MANYRNDFADVNLETGTICRNFMNHSIGSGDALGDRFGVRVFRNGEPVSLGGTVAGYFVRNTTGETVVISSGVVSGNEAYVTLPAACYAVEGSFTLAIKVTSGSETVTMRIIDGVVSRTNTSVTVDPGTLVPSIETLISAINSAVGQIPVNYNASFAPAYSASSTYAVGDYVVYDGYLWRCTTAITETESWTAAHWTKVALASDVSDLKSAINVVLLKAKYGFSENEGGPSSMNSSSALYDHRRVYINTANSANKDRLMVYDYTTSLWGWLGELKKQDVQGIIDNSHYAMMQYISTLLIDKGYIVYPYGILEINSDSSVDTSMIYVATTNTAANQRLMWYDGLNWNYALDIKITDFPFLTSITGKLAREESNILLSKSMFGITEYTGGISVINTNDADRQKIYIANVSGQNNGRFMYYNSNASEWQYLGDCYKSGFASLVTESQKMLRQYLVARLLEEGYLEYPGGTASINNDSSADTSRIYVAKTATANNNKLMWHDGYKWTYVDSVNDGDNIKISDLGNVDEILISSKRDYNYTDISSYVAGKLENIFDFNSAIKFVNLAFLTDTHRNVHDDSTILQYLKELELTDFLDAYVHGGDIIETYNMTRSQWIIAMGENIQAYKFYKNIMFIKGNHDNNHSETASENITNSQYKMVMNDFVTGLVFDESNESTCYYYKDFPYEKVRIVVLDTFEGSDENVSITNAQIDWLYTKALDVNDGWTVLLLSHMTPVSVGKCKRILQAFNDRGTQYGDYLFPDTITTYFAGIIHGHQHSDGYDNSNGFNDIAVTCGYGDGYGMDVATVDTSSKILHLTRFGSGSDRNYTFGESSGPVT